MRLIFFFFWGGVFQSMSSEVSHDTRFNPDTFLPYGHAFFLFLKDFRVRVSTCFFWLVQARSKTCVHGESRRSTVLVVRAPRYWTAFEPTSTRPSVRPSLRLF